MTPQPQCPYWKKDFVDIIAGGKPYCQNSNIHPHQPAAPDRRSTNEFLEALERTNCDERCKYFHSDICDQKCICQISHDIVAEHDATIRNETLPDINEVMGQIEQNGFYTGYREKEMVVKISDVRSVLEESLRTNPQEQPQQDNTTGGAQR